MTIQEEVLKHTWYQQIELGDGLVTPGIRKTVWEMYGLPTSLTGLTVLDVGSADGYFAFEAEKRGAKSVVAIDVWGREYDGGVKAAVDCGFRLLKRYFKSNVIQKVQSVYELDPRYDGVFDVVLFPQILYHLQNPLLALQKLFSVTGQKLFLETALDLENVDKPAMRYYPTNELCGDPTNWWGPNKLCVIEMLQTVGFKNVQVTWTNGERAAFIAIKE